MEFFLPLPWCRHGIFAVISFSVEFCPTVQKPVNEATENRPNTLIFSSPKLFHLDKRISNKKQQ